MKEYKKLCPFKWFVLQNFPFLDYDFDQITNWQLFQKIGEKINEIIESQNLVGQEMEQLVSAFNSLKDYVDNYFDNLDVQDEINNKLDEMADSGELAEIISQYLETQSLLCFNTKSDLAQADNLAEGSFVKTYGENVYSDGEGHFYKIRALINTDVIDNDHLIALSNYPTLVAEKIENPISVTKPQDMKHVIFIGDSYTVLSGQTTWDQVLVNRLGLTNGEYTKNGYSGTGFVHASDDKTFLTLLQNAKSSMSDQKITDTTHIIVCGGCNDAKDNISIADIKTAISNFMTYAKTNFPNAKVYIGMIGFMIAPSVKQYLNKVLTAYSSCTEYDAKYLSGVENVSHYYPYYTTNGVYSVTNQVHPNQDGSTAIGNGIYESLMRGYVNVFRGWESLLTNNELLLANHVLSYQNNNIYKFALNTNLRIINPITSTITCSPSNPIPLFDFQNGSVGGLENNKHVLKGTILVQNTSNEIIEIHGYYRIISFIVGENVAIRQRLEFVPLEPSPSTVDGYKIIENITHIYLSPLEMDLPIYEC